MSRKPKRKLKVSKALYFLLICGSLNAAQNQTYPTSPVTTLRDQTYIDALAEISSATTDVQLSTWTSSLQGKFKIDGSQEIQVLKLELTPGATEYGIIESTWSLDQFKGWLIDEVKWQMIQNIMDKDMEIYVVCPDTFSCTRQNWRGWCQAVIGKQIVPISCADEVHP